MIDMQFSYFVSDYHLWDVGGDKHCTRGGLPIVQSVDNVRSASTVKGRHMSEKPAEMLRHFFRLVVSEHTMMLDPTCGSGSALRAAQSLDGEESSGTRG
jgi:DNA modification methylase